MSLLHLLLVLFGLIAFFLPAIFTFSEESDVIRPLLQESQPLVLDTHKDAKSGTYLPGKGLKLAGLRIHPPLPKKALKVLRKGFDEIWKDRPNSDLQISSSTSWSKYYEVARKVAGQKDQLPAIQGLARKVRDLGPDFTNKVFDKRDIIVHVIRPIEDAYAALHSDYLADKERVWAVGVLSCLLSKTDNYKKDYSKKLKGIDTLRGDREVFFLKDLPVAEVVEKMWFDPDWPADNFIQIREALGRASVVASIEREMPKIYQPPYDAFQSIFRSFIKLDAPMSTDQALRFMDIISGYIVFHTDRWGGRPKSPDQNEKNVVRILFHMVKYNAINGEQFQEKFDSLIFRALGLSMILQSDILIELEALKLPPHLEKAFRPFRDMTKMKDDSLLLALKALTVDHPTQHHWGKLYSILDLLVEYDNKVYETLDKGLEGSPKLVSDMLKMLEEYRPAKFNPAWVTSSVRWKSLESLLKRKEREHNSWKHFNALQDYLIERQFFSSDLIARYSQLLSIDGQVPARKVKLLGLLNLILTRISRDQGEFSNPDIQHSIIEYTLLLASLRDGRRGVLDFYDHTNRALPNEITSKAFNEIQRVYEPGNEPGNDYNSLNLEIFIHGLQKMVQKSWTEMDRKAAPVHPQGSSIDVSKSVLST